MCISLGAKKERLLVLVGGDVGGQRGLASLVPKNRHAHWEKKKEGGRWGIFSIELCWLAMDLAGGEKVYKGRLKPTI